MTDYSRLKALKPPPPKRKFGDHPFLQLANQPISLLMIGSVLLNSIVFINNNYSACRQRRIVEDGSVRMTILELTHRARNILSVHDRFIKKGMRQNPSLQEQWLKKMEQMIQPGGNYFLSEFKDKSDIDLSLGIQITLEKWNLWRPLGHWHRAEEPATKAKSPSPAPTKGHGTKSNAPKGLNGQKKSHYDPANSTQIMALTSALTEVADLIKNPPDPSASQNMPLIEEQLRRLTSATHLNLRPVKGFRYIHSKICVLRALRP